MKTLLLLPLALVGMVGCSSQLTTKNNQKAPVSQPPIDGSEIAVIPNPYVDDLNLANKAAEETTRELTKRGYRVVANEAEAKLVAVPTIETNVTTTMRSSGERPLDSFPNSNLAEIDRANSVSNSLGSLGQISLFESGGLSPGTHKDLLVIEAFPKDAWDHALIVNELQLQPSWKIRMPLPVDLKPIEGENVAHRGNAADTDFQLPH
jgi:hypothetical protein